MLSLFLYLGLGGSWFATLIGLPFSSEATGFVGAAFSKTRAPPPAWDFDLGFL